MRGASASRTAVWLVRMHASNQRCCCVVQSWVFTNICEWIGHAYSANLLTWVYDMLKIWWFFTLVGHTSRLKCMEDETGTYCLILVECIIWYFVKLMWYLQDGKAAQAASNQETPLGQAYLKYLDALSLDQNNVLYNIHVGRLMLLQGNTDDAIQRLQLAVGLKPTFILAR